MRKKLGKVIAKKGIEHATPTTLEGVSQGPGDPGAKNVWRPKRMRLFPDPR